MIATPLEFIPAEPWDAFAARLGQLLTEKTVEQIVVGLPRNMDGSYGPAAAKVREFIERLRGFVTVPIRTWDERLTTAQANRVLLEGNMRRSDRREKVDQTAAAIILQSYLDSL